MYLCPSCRRRWTDENAEANGRRCYRACDTPLVHMEEEAGHHLNYLPNIVLGGDSGFDNLREAFLAVEPAGSIGIPPGRHVEPLVLDKSVTLERAGTGEVFLETEKAPAVRVFNDPEQKDPTWAGPVTIENITIFRGGTRDGLPLVIVQSGELVLRGCRLDCRRGPGILVKKGAHLRCEKSLFVMPGSFGLHCEDGASLDMVDCEFIGSEEGISPVAQVTETESAPLARGAAISGSDGASFTISDTVIRGFRVGLALKGCGGSAVGMEIQDCELAALFQDPKSFLMQDCSISGDDEALLTAHGGHCRLIDCHFTGGGVQVTVDGAKIEITGSEFRQSTKTACLILDKGETEIRDCGFLTSEGNGLAVSGDTTCIVTDTSFTNVAGVGLLALSGSKPEMTGCRLIGSGVGICVLPKASPGIRETTVNGSLGSGVLLQDGANGVFESLTIEESRADQFVVGRCEEPVELRGCHFSNGNHAALRLVDGARAVLRNSRLENNGGDGVSSGGNSGIQMFETIITGNGGSGILVGPSAIARLEDCTLASNQSCGIRTFEANSVQTIRGTIEGNGYAGLFLDNTAALVCNSTEISGNEGPGVVLSASPGQDEDNHAELQGCTLTENTGEGLLGLGGGKAALEQCIVAGNGGAGFRVWGSFRLAIEGGTCRRTSGPPNRIGRGAVGVIQNCRFEGGTTQLILSGGGRAVLANNNWPTNRWRSIRPYLAARIRKPG